MADLGSIPALKDAIAARIFPNTTFEVSATDIDESFIDTIDTLKALLVAFNDTNYGDLLLNFNNGTLTPGAFYAFDYEHKYVVDFLQSSGGSGTNGEILNTDVGTIHEPNISNVLQAFPYTAPTEKLIVQAVSATQLSPQAISTVHPADIIFYDIADNRTEEVSNAAQNRTGFIQYREDPTRSIKADFDFRSSIGFVKKRTDKDVMTEQYNAEPVLQFNNQQPSAAFNPILGWDTSAGAVSNLAVGANIYFRMLGGYQNTNVDGPSSLNYKNIEIGRADGFLDYGSVYGVGRVPNTIIAAVHAQNIKIGADCQRICLTGNTYYNVEIGTRCSDIMVNNSPIDPTAAITAGPFSQASWQDVKIGSAVRYFFSAGGQNIYIGDSCSNITQTSGAFRVTIKSNCIDVSIIDGVTHFELEENCVDVVSWASSVKVGEGSSDLIFIHAGKGADTLNVLGRNNDNVYMAHCFNMSIGDDNVNLRLQTQNECRIGNNNVNLYLQDGFNNIIGDGNETIELQSSQGHMDIGNHNTNLRLDASHTQIGNDNQDIYFIDPIVDSYMGSHNSNILAYQSDDLNIGNRNQDILIQTCFNVKMGDENQTITLENKQDIVVGSNNYRITNAEQPLLFSPRFSIPSSTRGIIYDHANQADFWDGTTFVSFTRLLNVSTNKAINVAYASSGGSGMVIGSNCTNLIMSGGSDLVIGDNVENFINCHEIDFANVADLIIPLDVALTASTAVLTMSTAVVGLNPGSITINVDESAPTPVLLKVGANVTASISSFLTAAIGNGGNDITIEPNLSNVKLKGNCNGIRVKASDVDLTTITDVVVATSWTDVGPIPAPPAGVIVDLVSPDGSGWYSTIANNGTVTRTKYE